VLVFDGCYHGAVDETLVRLVDGRPAHRPGLIGQAVDLTANTKVIAFNDVAALEAALAPRDVACVLAEPAMTNAGIVLPDPGFHAALRDITRRTGALLVIDETHTISTGPGGYTRAHGLDPDFFVLGKPIAGGIPGAVFGFTEEVAERMQGLAVEPGHTGIGTTLSGNALALAAMRAMLEQVMTEAAYAHMLRMGERMANGLRRVIGERALPWSVTQLGARAEFMFASTPPRNGGEARAGMDPDLERAIHLYLLNQGVLVTPFHNMLLTCPATTSADVDRLIEAFDACLDELTAA
jgi:glutamate-1-semialdehyde 2,1-aminomutase